MTKRIYEFVCKNDHINEIYVDSAVRTVNCQVCSQDAERMISSPAIKLEGWSGSFPGAANKFDRIHREKLKAEQKANS
jgi:hypothetical protein